MNSRQLLEIANRAIATGGIAPPSEVLEMAKFCRDSCLFYTDLGLGNITLHERPNPDYKPAPYQVWDCLTGKEVPLHQLSRAVMKQTKKSDNTRDYAD